MKKENKEKKTLKFSSVKHGRGILLTHFGYHIYEIIQNRLKKGWRNIPKHNKEWDEIMNHYILPFLYFIDKSQSLQKHHKETFENEGYVVEYDGKEIDKEVDEVWSRYIQLGKKSLPNNS